MALLGLLLLVTAPEAAQAQQPATTSEAAATPEKVRALLSLMDDPEVRQWLGEHQKEAPAARAPAAPTSAMMDMTAPVMVIRHHILASLAALPTALPELARVTQALGAEIAAQGLWEPCCLSQCSWRSGLCRAALLAGNRRLPPPADRDAAGHGQERLRAVGLRLAFGLGWTASFAVGSLGAFLLFDWPPLLHALIARVLLLVVVVWLTTILLRFVFAPGAERFRILPVSTASAQHWYFWLDDRRGLVRRRPCPAPVSDRSWPVRAGADTCSPTSFRSSGWVSCCWRFGGGPRCVRRTSRAPSGGRQRGCAMRF